MKRFGALFLMIGLASAVPAAFAREGKSGEQAAHEQKSESSGEGEEGKLAPWKWANFALLAAALGYGVVKFAPAFFDARSREIRKGIVEAGDLRKEAEARAIAVQRRLNGLSAEIAALREESRAEAEAEKHRIGKQTEAEIAKLQANAELEIASAAKAARAELKRYSAHLAVTLAEGKIRGRMTGKSQDALVQGFVRDLGEPASKAHSI